VTPKYAKDFLQDVLIRGDFASPVEGFSKSPPKGFLEAAKSAGFARLEPREVVGQTLMLGKDSLKHERVTGQEWIVHESEGKGHVNLGTGAMYISRQKHKGYESQRDAFLSLLDSLYAVQPELALKRLGLRYIDVIRLDGSTALDWREYIHDDLICSLGFSKKAPLVRAFNVLEYDYGDFRLKFQYGMPNPDYPARIVQRQFVLDMDAYVDALLEPNDVPSVLDGAHSAVSELYEDCILDRLRDVMGVVES